MNCEVCGCADVRGVCVCGSELPVGPARLAGARGAAEATSTSCGLHDWPRQTLMSQSMTGRVGVSHDSP